MWPPYFRKHGPDRSRVELRSDPNWVWSPWRESRRPCVASFAASPGMRSPWPQSRGKHGWPLRKARDARHARQAIENQCRSIDVFEYTTPPRPGRTAGPEPEARRRLGHVATLPPEPVARGIGEPIGPWASRRAPAQCSTAEGDRRGRHRGPSGVEKRRRADRQCRRDDW